jgi:hypothetical protein
MAGHTKTIGCAAVRERAHQPLLVAVRACVATCENVQHIQALCSLVFAGVFWQPDFRCIFWKKDQQLLEKTNMPYEHPSLL